jgi:F-type H+-transporting ATPase subunit a
MHNEKAFTWLEYVGLGSYPNHVVMALFAAIVLVATTWIARVQLSSVMKSPGEGLVPESKLTYRNFFEILAESLFGLTESVLGPDAATYFPVIGTTFLFVFFSNILGLIPGVLPATENLNTTLALGLFVFIYYNFAGLRANGLSYLKHFLGPVAWLAPLMVIIELASHLFRPLSLSLRLRGNIMGDHVVLHIFSGLAPYFIPVIFYGLGVFVAFIQAFVFCLMTMVYISLSIAHDEH